MTKRCTAPPPPVDIPEVGRAPPDCVVCFVPRLGGQSLQHIVGPAYDEHSMRNGRVAFYPVGKIGTKPITFVRTIAALKLRRSTGDVVRLTTLATLRRTDIA